MAGESNDAAYCRDRVGRFDPDRAAVIAFQPAATRPALYALHAFNLEVAHLRETAGEPALGAMRLQWWRDALDEAASGRERRHAVLQPLAAAIREHGLPEDRFRRLLDARELDLDAAPPADLPAYARETGGTLAALAGPDRERAGQAARISARPGRSSAGCGPPRSSAGHCRRAPGRAPSRNRPQRFWRPPATATGARSRR